MPGVAAIVTGPVATPPNDGLRGARGLGVIENPNDPEPTARDWVRGYQFTYEPCVLGATRDPCDRLNPKDYTRGKRLRRVEPFLAIVGRVCSTYGWEAQDYVADATQALDAHQYGIIARELWTGAQALESGWWHPPVTDPTGVALQPVGNPFLAWHLDPEFTVIAPGDTLHPVTALAELEDALGDCAPSGGVIHATRRMATLWAAWHLITREGGRLFTALGTQVIADRAYDGSSPTSDGPGPDDPPLPGVPATDDEEWAYATGPITLRIETGAPMVVPPAGDLAEATNRAVNDIAYVAERKVSPSWGCCHLAVAIAPTPPT